jgi:hypothetical protein
MRYKLFDGSGEVEIHFNSFPSNFKGTCPLCFNTIRHGHKLVPMMVSAYGDKFRRNVHVECARDIILSSPIDMAKDFIIDLEDASLSLA